MWLGLGLQRFRFSLLPVTITTTIALHGELRRPPYDELLRADVLSLMCPLSFETRWRYLVWEEGLQPQLHYKRLIQCSGFFLLELVSVELSELRVDC